MQGILLGSVSITRVIVEGLEGGVGDDGGVEEGQVLPRAPAVPLPGRGRPHELEARRVQACDLKVGEHIRHPTATKRRDANGDQVGFGGGVAEHAAEGRPKRRLLAREQGPEEPAQRDPGQGRVQQAESLDSRAL